ncbi:protein lines-like [Macrosteles quadrilineatus]|uniref:protein lines-like n=1 Tax=Macrosteles quadrilineatus TaxID=74068 RepID=UPI0023E19198|nr:protein lines-like [Macrosteles quadrilineatus]
MVLKKGNTVPLSVPGMGEPVKKKQKLREDSRNESCNEDLEQLQRNLLNQCLCSMSESCLRKPFQGMKVVTEEDIQGFRHTVVAEWNRNRTLQFVSCVQLLCEVAIKQNAKGLLCSRIGDVCDALVRNEYGLVDHLIELADHPDRFVCFSAGRALSSFFLVSRAHVDPRWLDRLTDNALSISNPQKVSFSLEVFKRVIEWKDCDEHPLEQRGEDDHIASCHALSVNDPESHDSSQIKCLCIKALESKWPTIINRFDALISSYSPSYESTIVTFLDLWEMIISVKANLSVVDTKPFYDHVDSFVALLNSGVPPVIWKHLLGLFNEVLCYGSTLALQDILDDEPCALAHLIVRSVKDWRLLDSLPYRGGGGGFVGGAGDGDRPLLQKATLLVLKAVAVTVKETRSDSSSDSSLGSETEDADADMAVIERSIREVLRQLDLCVKALLPYHPETPVAQWVVQLFTDQDDALIEAMVCCLDVTVGLCYRETTLPDLRRILNPISTFVQFLQTVSHDPDVLLDLLVSNETCFLLYLLRLLKYIRRNWTEFVTVCAQDLDDTMSVIIRLRLAIDRLVSKDLFPYNINPVLRLLEKCENLYEGSSAS